MSNTCNGGCGSDHGNPSRVTGDISSNDVDFEAIAESRHAYIEGYLVSNASGFEAARAAQEAAKESGAVLALTLSDPGIVENFKTEFEILVENGRPCFL